MAQAQRTAEVRTMGGRERIGGHLKSEGLGARLIVQREADHVAPGLGDLWRAAVSASRRIDGRRAEQADRAGWEAGSASASEPLACKKSSQHSRHMVAVRLTGG
jgi:hypothetical protein